MKIDFTGRRVLVTASTGGIGFAVAKGFLAAGASVVINGRSQATVAAAISRLGGAGSGGAGLGSASLGDAGLGDPENRIGGFAGDLGDEDACWRLIEQHPDFDILINNLGIYGPQDFFDTPDRDWERFFQTNVMSGVRLARAYAKAMADRGWGRVVFVSSESAINIPVDMIHYGFTKTAQLAISRGLAKRLAGTGVTVNAVLPGPTLSDGVAGMLQADVDRSGNSLEQVAADFIEAHRSSSIIRRAASVEEIANMILYVSSEQASATTGAALRVDGGIVDTIV